MEQYCELNYKKFGDSDSVVVILHGLFGMLDNWKSFARKLSADYTVYIVDLRNHGKSCHSEEMDYAIMATDIQSFMTTHDLHKINIVGHSMGGKVAMHFAITYPDLVEKLVVVDIAPKTYKPSHLPIFEALFSIDLSQRLDRKDIEQQLAQKIPNSGIVQFLLKNLKRVADNHYEWKFNLPVIYKSYKKINAQPIVKGSFEKATLFVKGSNSAYILTSDKNQILQHFPEATVKEIEQAGHWVHAEQPEQLLKALRTFLDS